MTAPLRKIVKVATPGARWTAAGLDCGHIVTVSRADQRAEVVACEECERGTPAYFTGIG
ncbi:phage terminase large subunit-like protein [Actinomadura coerulea]|uniref:Phage terminase large subunit-like protein n=1 Tax=Actinomadura coerulea TaxID=46159 RepID=A0A7X0G6Q0_9ACTN|nr:hypothetical protein [Actinomadura coerulea]MBB6400505.1 phage terminase large subunit-like protein [Actinomadura coerulea]GGQ07725.1 hypothetical protein GCM10010187_24710 [Actinomadura coerulea]